MPMPTTASKANCDGSTDDPKLALLTDLADLIDKFNDLIAMRAAASGYCDLDSSTKVPSARLATALAAIYALTPAADRGVYFTSASAASLFTLSSFARTLLDDADAAAARATLAITTPALSAEYESSQQAITLGSMTTLAHSLGVIPKVVHAYLVCTTTEQGYSVGDTVHIGYTTGTDRGILLALDATYVYAWFGSASTVLPNKSTGAGFNITPANWRFIVRAYA